jgi:hypothetical protein
MKLARERNAFAQKGSAANFFVPGADAAKLAVSSQQGTGLIEGCCPSMFSLTTPELGRRINLDGSNGNASQSRRDGLNLASS